MMKNKSRWRDFLQNDLTALAGIAGIKLSIHLLTSQQYGYFRDEFYYIAASKRLALGYVDFPPFIALLTAFIRATLGESLLALHFFPALAGALVVFITGLMARQLGVSRYGQVAAALAALIAPIFLGTNSLLTMDSFDQLWWVLGAYLLICIFRDDNPRLWPWFGLVAGIGLLTKISMLYFGFALALGLALTPWRKSFRSPWLYLGGGIALSFLLPYIAWNAVHGWPTPEFWGSYAEKVYQASPLEFLFQQIVLIHPISLGLWIAGLVYVFSKTGQRYRPLGWIYIILLAVFVIQNAKNYFLAPAYPMLLALGAAAFEKLIPQKSLWQWLMPSHQMLIIFGLLSAAYALPILPIDTLVRVLNTIGGINVQSERLESGVLPQYFADRFGWQEMTATVVQVYQSLSPEDRAEACIFTQNYGEAGALEFFGASDDLPPVISGHNNYHLWGPGDCTGAVMIVVDSPDAQVDLQGVFGEVRLVAKVDCDFCMPYEAENVVFIARRPNISIQDIWPETKHFD
jgi:hypothetical protein